VKLELGHSTIQRLSSASGQWQRNVFQISFTALSSTAINPFHQQVPVLHRPRLPDGGLNDLLLLKWNPRAASSTHSAFS